MTHGSAPRSGHARVGGAHLFYRTIGHGQPLVILHGGPEFDHTYLLPELDSLTDSFRLTYYDQRGRGRSAEGVKPEDVTIASEVEDLDALTRQLGLESFALLGHSWGGVLAMEYAVRHPDRLTHLILMNSAPGSHRDVLLLRQHLLDLRTPSEVERMKAISLSPEFQSGNLEVEAEYLRIHFRVAVSQPNLVEKVVRRLRTHFDEAGVVRARAIDRRLSEETWLKEDYDILPQLASRTVPTLVIHGDRDFIPIHVARHIAQAIPGAHLVVIHDCGHFAYLEQPTAVRDHIAAFVIGGG